MGTEVPIFAGVCDGKGQLQPYEKVEWLLDHSGVGSFVSVSEAYRPFYLDLFSKKPAKIDNNYAWAETLPINVILTRGTPQITDDMVMPRGYTWVTVTSPREGISYITAYAPDVYSWDTREKSSTIYWIDAEWTFPEPACVPIGEHAMLTTCVRRHTTKAPVSDWIVKYCITGGVDATFHDGSKSTEVATDAEGRSTVEVIPTTGNNGATCISIELIRSECVPQGEPERLSIATAATQVNWAIKDGEAAAPTAAVPATPPATLPAMPPTTTPLAPPITRPSLPPTTSPPVQPATPAAPPAQPAAAPKISLNVTGPESAQPGTDIRFILEVTNSGNAASPELVVTDRYDQGLEYAVKANPLQNKLGVIQPGEKKQVGITFRVTRAGRLCHVVEVTGPGNIHETKQVCVNVTGEPAPPEQPAISLRHCDTAESIYRRPASAVYDRRNQHRLDDSGSTSAFGAPFRSAIACGPGDAGFSADRGRRSSIQYRFDTARWARTTASGMHVYSAIGKCVRPYNVQRLIAIESGARGVSVDSTGAGSSRATEQFAGANTGDQQSRESWRQCHVPNYCHECRYESGKKRAFVAGTAGINDLRNENRAVDVSTTMDRTSSFFQFWNCDPKSRSF